MVTCHLGGGCTVAAIKGGQAIDTTATFGTCGGIPMGTRAGDVDSGVLLHLLEQCGYSVADLRDLLYRQSGLLGVSGISADMRDIAKAAEANNPRAHLARNMFAYAIRKIIGAFAAALEGLDAIVFTAGIGENDSGLRALVCAPLAWMGVHLDEEGNESRGRETVISAENSPVKVLVIPTNEELMIAREAATLVGYSKPEGARGIEE